MHAYFAEAKRETSGVSTMQRKAITHLSLALVAMVGVSSALNLGAGPALASSHREAPLISQDPAADATDLYAFVSPDAPNTVTFIANYYTMQDPAGFPNFYRFGDDVTTATRGTQSTEREYHVDHTPRN